jgi:hypothetical protein
MAGMSVEGRMRSDYSAIAQSILTSVRSNFLPEHEYARATASAFKHLNLDFYRKTQASLEALEFVLVADVEDRTISRAGSVVTFIRTMRHPGTDATAAFFFVPPMARGFVEFETLLSDQHFIVDTNIPPGDSMADFPGIDMACHAPGSALKKMLNAHARRVRERLSRHKGTKVEPIATFAAVVHAQNLMNRRKHDHLAAIGWVTLDYLKRQTRGDDEMAKGVYDAIQDILGGKTKQAAKPTRRAGKAATEMATSENEGLVSRVYAQALQDRHDGRKLAAADLMVYHIEMLSQEVNSGASFEQYFRWASVEEISAVVSRLESLALPKVAQIVRRAIGVAFPNGLPATDEEKSELIEWTEAQEKRLGACATAFEKFNGRILNVLAAYYRKSKPGA